MVFQKGELHHLFGKHHPDETKQKISVSLKKTLENLELRKARSDNLKGKYTGEKSPNFGSKRTLEQLEKMSIAHKGQIPNRKGISHSEESKQKMSISHKGKYARENSWFFGKKQSPELIAKRIGDRKGEKHPNWKGGISHLPYCEKFDEPFKERVRAFFGYICVECGTPQESQFRKLDVHHIHYDKMMCCNGSPRDVVALCCICNIKANYNREYWEKHFTEIIYQYYQGKCFFTKEEFADWKVNNS